MVYFSIEMWTTSLLIYTFYETEHYELVDELSLTKKQNLGDYKNLSISTQLIGDNLRIYNANFMNNCMIKTTHNNVYTK